VWDWLEGRWRTAERRDLHPGQTVLVAAQCGGYDLNIGWNPDAKESVAPVPAPEPSAEELADSAQDDEQLSAFPWQTIAVHGAAVGELASTLATQLRPGLQTLFHLAGRWHDAGKVHEAFQNSIRKSAERPSRRDLAKAPEGAWLRGRALYPDNQGRRRAGFRHELASVLGLFAVLSRHQPDHSALLGPWSALLDAAGTPVSTRNAAEAPPNALEREVLALTAEEFDLLAYLVCTHHGKVRVAWHASPADQETADPVLRIRGIRDGEVLPPVALTAADGGHVELPASILQLAPASIGINPVTGRGWTERVLDLLRRHGPFSLAYFEAILRAADIRASRLPLADALLQEDTHDYGLGRSRSAVAGVAPGGEGAAAVGTDPAQRGAEHGVRGGAGGSGGAGGTTRAPTHATRYLETTHGVLSYTELAPLLAKRAAAIEQDIEANVYDDLKSGTELLIRLQTDLCASLVPQFVGLRKVDVSVGQHSPPPFHQVRMALLEYERDLAARFLSPAITERGFLLESLAFAEGRLLSIHPFVDFNGRVTRLFLRLFLLRLDLPSVDLVPSMADHPAYLAALAAGDQADWQPLALVWGQRLGQGAQS
jgi:CRISPR-associated endonuclease/helicase Cas3